MHGNLLNKNKLKLFNTANSDLAGRIAILENNVYKITYYEIISGASGSLTIPTGATINAYEFSGANCILSEIDVNNKPTWVSPTTVGGTVVTASLNTGTGAWVKSGVTVSANVALIYSINIKGIDYANLNNFYIIEETTIPDLSYLEKGGFGITVDGGSVTPTTGSKGYVVIPYAGTITDWYIVGDASGSAVIDVKRSGSSIVGAGNKPTLTAAQRANAAVSAWTSTTIAANDEIEFVVDSVSTVKRINLLIKVTKS